MQKQSPRSVMGVTSARRDKLLRIYRSLHGRGGVKKLSHNVATDLAEALKNQRAVEQCAADAIEQQVNGSFYVRLLCSEDE
jgi:hypothetical protein